MVYRKPLNTMGLLGMLFGSSPKTKSDYDAEIARLKGELANAKLLLKQAKEFNKENKGRGVRRATNEGEIAYLNSRIASLKAARAKAPKG